MEIKGEHTKKYKYNMSSISKSPQLLRQSAPGSQIKHWHHTVIDCSLEGRFTQKWKFPRYAFATISIEWWSFQVHKTLSESKRIEKLQATPIQLK